jgi:hypothetical protein
MPFPRKRNALQFTEPELRKLESIRKSRTEQKRRTVRAALLLDSLSGSFSSGLSPEGSGTGSP